MKVRSALFFVIIALTSAAGCASTTGRTALDPGSGLASPAPTVPDCRNQGSYNRAANLCVSNGP